MNSSTDIFETYYNGGLYKTVRLKNYSANQLTVGEIVQQLTSVLKVERDKNGDLVKLLPSKDVIDLIALQLCDLANELAPSTAIPATLIDLLRSLRNSAVACEIQDHIAGHPEILNTIHKICHFVLSTINTDQLWLKVAFQFLINLVTSNEKSAATVYNKFNDTIHECLDQSVCIYECSALIYNISRFINLSSDLINKVLSFGNSENHNEYILFFMDNMISSEYFWTVYTKELHTDSKVVIMEFLKVKLLDTISVNLALLSIEILSQEFINSAQTIFYKDNVHNQEAYKVSLTLQILSSLSSNENYLPIFQKSKDLLINCGGVLINIHKLGKISENSFTPLQKLTELETDELNQHPAFGFKADLIRLIGNMCWKNLQMQNLARTAELIPVILDCCNMDAKNPFIIQWCILAIRNLCEGNIENQNVIASLHQEGSVSSAVLEEMGMTLHNDGEHVLKIISLNELSNKK